MWRAARWVEAARSLPDLPLTTDALRSGRLGEGVDMLRRNMRSGIGPIVEWLERRRPTDEEMRR